MKPLASVGVIGCHPLMASQTEQTNIDPQSMNSLWKAADRSIGHFSRAQGASVRQPLWQYTGRSQSTRIPAKRKVVVTKSLFT